MISLFVNNTPASNKIINSTGNQVTLNLAVPIDLSDGKKYQLRCLQASVVYCEPNIISGVNSYFSFKCNHVAYNFSLPTGLYDLASLEQEISTYTAQHCNYADIFSFSGDEATSQTIVQFNNVNIQSSIVLVNDPLSTNTNVMSILGFNIDSSEIGNFSSTLVDACVVTSENKAQLNSIQNILVRCSATQGCSFLNNNLDNIIASIQPDVEPWSTIEYNPIHPIRCNISIKNIQQITFTLLDQNGNNIDFTSNGTDIAELWSLVITIEPIQMMGLL